MLKGYIKKTLKILANLQLAITLLFIIGLIIAVGTVVEQDQALTFYKNSYPELKPLFGFLTWKVIIFFSLDKVYTSWYFVVVLILFGSSLLACTFTTQLPSIKLFKIWKFYTKKKQLTDLNISESIKLKFFNSVPYQFNNTNYHFFRQQKKSYAYSGLLGRVAPVVVHLSIIILLLGSTIGSFGGFIAQQLVPRGELTHIQNVTKFGKFSSLPQDLSIRVNDFWITYTADSQTDQFYSDLSVLNSQGKEIKRKTVFVNEPLTVEGVVLYQTDWDIIGLKLRLPNDQIFQVPLKKITKNGSKFWVGSLNFDSTLRQKYSVVSNSLNGKLSLYNEQGVKLNDLQLGEKIYLDKNIGLEVVDFITSTGLQIKVDPGIQTVYASFLLLIISIYVSFFSYSQIWLVETAKRITIGGNSNRAVLFFQQEFRTLIKQSTLP
jgi:cytochrome c biogenesis protein